MKNRRFLIGGFYFENCFFNVFLSISFITLIGCHSSNRFPDPIYRNTISNYNMIKVSITSDSLYFPLDDTTYNDIKSFNLFEGNGREYISFYDRRSESINIYDFAAKKKVKRLSLKTLFKKRKMYKTSVFVRTLDSIFITNQMKLYHLNSNGDIRKKIDFLEHPKYEWAYFDNVVPPVLKNGYLYTGVRPYVNAASFNSLREWKTLYAFDLTKAKATLYYPLPKAYRQNLYGDNFLAYNYCINDEGNFVFSFPADTNIYETDLDKIHFAYTAKSLFQTAAITPVPKELLKTDKGSREYALRHAYSTIYFDPYRKRYWRISKQKMKLEEYKKQKRKFSITILDKDMQVIGESELNDTIALNTIFFTRNGSIYARINIADEYAIHYVRLEYQEKK